MVNQLALPTSPKTSTPYRDSTQHGWVCFMPGCEAPVMDAFGMYEGTDVRYKFCLRHVQRLPDNVTEWRKGWRR